MLCPTRGRGAQHQASFSAQMGNAICLAAISNARRLSRQNVAKLKWNMVPEKKGEPIESTLKLVNSQILAHNWSTNALSGQSSVRRSAMQQRLNKAVSNVVFRTDPQGASSVSKTRGAAGETIERVPRDQAFAETAWRPQFSEPGRQMPSIELACGSEVLRTHN